MIKYNSMTEHPDWETFRQLKTQIDHLEKVAEKLKEKIESEVYP